ncbi:SusC/RagA family TonB-linked outer membrane protein [Flagellimonas taeanensis]|uniref:TonB-linked outer membrane protein, SusC/RagA family n=1 Tax=Flagellimonas taeanensis TaxID=1005926 RepID=A0A1M6WWC7_9FLAO|nr:MULTISPECIES: TonB-dependent receptor [Allomuricauda]MDC6386575.1 TonB-dependent receptor [Muricauda sp. SK9]RIV51294.1 SusC/RagA family TonB-linked outer membrane protein [Allomuricauda taeanensis]SFB99894.1 TonB-linked outer membrane protein, SusC/RagA family [Allomuricauda taeanensis]SHK97951.1 TonB-linked outer membrane protein, SusC/RagA family [Allomuricauda taeanensis]
MKENQTICAWAKKLSKNVLCCLSLLLFFSFGNATNCAQDDVVTMSFENQQVGDIFETITKSTGYKFFYEASEVDLTRKVTIFHKNLCIEDFLKQLFKGSGLSYEVIARQIVIKKVGEPTLPSLVPQKKIEIQDPQSMLTGTVVDENGVPLPGASIIAKGTTVGTTTDFDGKFELSLPSGTTVIQVTYIGYKPKEVSVAGLTTVTVRMEPDAAALEEVVVVGYGTLAKTKVTGSVVSIQPETIVNVPTITPEGALIGQVAGVQVQEVSGEPGAAPNIRIRGSGSISAGNDPLFVVDGIPISRNLTSSSQLGSLSNQSQAFQPPTINPLGTLNPNDIESMQVLKDASAAAIYGSRGGNGVLLITTKKGSSTEEGVFSFDSYVSIQSVANKIDLMNAAELIDYTRDARNNNYLVDIPGASVDDPIGPGDRGNTNYEMPASYVNWDGTDTDWQDLIFKTGVVQSYNFSYASPIRNKTSFYTSAGYFSQNGIIEKSKFERYSVLMNLNSQLTEKLNLDLRLAPTVTENQRVPANSPYFATPPGIVYSAIVHSPVVKPYNADGTINQLDNQSHLAGGTTTASNPLAIIEGVDDQIFQFQNRGTLGLTYDILPDLSFKTLGGVYINLFNQDFYRANTLLLRNSTVGNPYGQASTSTETNWLWENTLSWKKEIGDHYVDAVLGYTAQKDNVRLERVVANNYPDDLVTTISGGQVYAGTSVKEQWSLLSSLFRVNYSFKDKYLFTGTIRSDKSSRFGKNNQTGYFPSFSVGWRLNEESFLSSSETISELKLRMSWGQTGNFEIPNYGAVGLLSPQNYNLAGNEVNGIIQSTIPNPNLTWEKSEQVDVGLELGLFNNRVFLLADYYDTKTRDLLLNVAISSVSGFETTLRNLGKVQNKGFEIALSTKNFVGDFSWDTDINFSTNKNEVLALNEGNEPIYSTGSAGIRHVTRVGDPIGSYYGYVVEGIYQTQEEIDNAPVDTQAPNPGPGDFKFKDVDGDGQITPDDRTVTGSYFPDFTWGINNRLSFKGVDFGFLIQGVEGNEILNLTGRHLLNGEANFNSYAAFNDRWRSASDPGNGWVPRADRGTGNHGNNQRPSSFQVEDGSYIRLRNVTLGYTLPTDNLFGNKIQKLRFYITGTNLFTITDYMGYNPEVSSITTNSLTPGEDYGAFPLTKSFTMGVNLKF